MNLCIKTVGKVGLCSLHDIQIKMDFENQYWLLLKNISMTEQERTAIF